MHAKKKRSFVFTLAKGKKTKKKRIATIER
jgi:hypothetical protein